ncbi:hypothetical protein ACHAPT_008156 [Fusarium lateritium]
MADQLSKATELAEVFALGRIMWMLLTQTVGGFDEIEHPNNVQVTWDNEHNIPSHWIEMVERCMDKNPNERPCLEDLVKFWRDEELPLRYGFEMASPLGGSRNRTQ